MNQIATFLLASDTTPSDGAGGYFFGLFIGIGVAVAILALFAKKK